MKTTVR